MVIVTPPVEQVHGVPAVQRGHHGVVGVEGGQPVLQPGPGAELPRPRVVTRPEQRHAGGGDGDQGRPRPRHGRGVALGLHHHLLLLLV